MMMTPREGSEGPHETLLQAGARFAKSERATVIVIVPRRAGVVNRARDVARGAGLNSTAEISADHVSVWMTPV